jgi:hypothetical protein
MPRFLIVDPAAETGAEIDFSLFVQIVKGMTVTSAASSDDMKYLEFGLSENFNLNVRQDEDGDIVVQLFSTLNLDDIPPLRLQIVSDDEEASAETLERRIRLLRQTYAIGLLVNTGRAEQISDLLSKDPNADIEASLLNEEEKLYIKSAGPGSFWVTVLIKSKAGYKTAAALFSTFYDEGRELLLRRMRANTVLKELEAEQRRFDLQKKQALGMIEVFDKISKMKDEKASEMIRAAFESNLKALGSDAGHLLLNFNQGEETPTVSGAIPDLRKKPKDR